MPPATLKAGLTGYSGPWLPTSSSKGDDGEGIPKGLLKAKTALVLNTSNTPEELELEVIGDPLERLWKHCICSFCGIPVCYRRMFGVVVTSTAEQRKAWLDEVRELTRYTFPTGVR